MSAVINTNVMSLNAQRNLTGSQSALQTSLQRLSSGLRINSAKDDAAGLAISERMTGQVRGMNQAIRNANDGISMMQTAEGALAEATNMLQRVRELAVQSSNATNSAMDRKALQAEVSQLVSELDRMAQTTEFNGMKLLDGSTGAQHFQVGANAGQTITATTGNFRTNSYGNSYYASDAVAASSGAAYTAGTVSIQGINAADISVAADDTAATLATKINAAQDKTGVTATAKTTVEIGLVADASYTIGIKSNNSEVVNVSFAVGELNADGLAAAMAAINEAASKTGVTAELNENGDGLILTNSSGENISLTNGASSGDAVTMQTLEADGTGVGTAASLAAGGSATAIGFIELNSDSGFGVTVDTSDAFSDGSAELQSVNTIDISTVDGAQKAIRIVDSALNKVNAQRAQFGAIQSRFESTVNNLQTSTENLQAARSRIRDTDFAAETANLTRAQILQQAGTAMLAQANQVPQTVLSLLR